MSELFIIGGNHAGLTAAKRIGKSGVKINLVTPNENGYFNALSTRAIVEPEIVLTKPIDVILKGLNVNHIKGEVKQLHPKQNKLEIQMNDGSLKEVTYGHVIIATGASTIHKAFRCSGNDQDSSEDLNSLSKKISNARSIAIIGGGSVGVELSGEIMEKFPKVNLDLYTGSQLPLPFLKSSDSKYAEKVLAGLGVNVINDIRINRFTASSLHDGSEKKDYDLVIPTTGVKPNTLFLPKEMLDDKGYLLSDKHFVNPIYKNVIGFGEVLSITDGSIVDINTNQINVLDQTFKKCVLGQTLKLKDYTKGPFTMIIGIGKQHGIGYIYGNRIPEFAVRFFKAKSYFIPHKIYNAY